jgi:hypothetical protein
MDRRAVEAFVGRDWHAVAASKVAYWADRFRQDGWRPAWNASDMLLLDVRRTRPEFPTEQDRRLDFAAHLKLRDRLDRAAHALTRR